MVGCVVLNYNDSKTTIELINRIGKMTSIDVIVIVDNNSTDDSFSVLKQYASEKFMLYNLIKMVVMDMEITVVLNS